MNSPDDHSHFESLARNRVSNVSFAISSAGEIVILAIMVGILKALNAGASAENNTRAFSVLIAFSGGVWCASLLTGTTMRLRDSLMLPSYLCHSLVYFRKAPAWSRPSSGDVFRDHWIQAGLRCLTRVLTIETNVLVSYILFSHVNPSLSFNVQVPNPFFRRGDVLNTTV